MYLLIDLSKKDKIKLALFSKDNKVEAEYNGRNCELLSSIDDFFIKQDFKKEDLKGIMVVVGEGSFTNTRISAVVANTFGFAMQIPLLAIESAQIDKVQDLIEELQRQPVGQYISATYSAPPNIG